MGFRTGFVLSSVFFLYGFLFLASVYDFPLLYAAAPAPPPTSSSSSTFPVADALDATFQHHAHQAEAFYLHLVAAPSAVKALLHGMIGLGLVGLLAKLHRWTPAAKLYDGTSIGLYVALIALYAGVTVPNLRLLSNPTDVDLIAVSSVRTAREHSDAIRALSGGLRRAGGSALAAAASRVAANVGGGAAAGGGDAAAAAAAEAEAAARRRLELLEAPLSESERLDVVRVVAASNSLAMALLAGVVAMQSVEFYLERRQRADEERRRQREARELGLGKKDL